MAAKRKGWSGLRGTAPHYIDDGNSERGLCGAPIKLTSLDGLSDAQRKRLRAQEVCDRCQRVVWSRSRKKR